MESDRRRRTREFSIARVGRLEMVFFLVVVGVMVVVVGGVVVVVVVFLVWMFAGAIRCLVAVTL